MRRAANIETIYKGGNTMNKRMRTAFESYQKSNMFDLYDAYKSFSPAKAKAWEYCKELKREKNGIGLMVISANTFMFTAGFTFEEDGKQMFCYITPSADTFAKIQ